MWFIRRKPTEISSNIKVFLWKKRTWKSPRLLSVYAAITWYPLFRECVIPCVCGLRFKDLFCSHGNGSRYCVSDQSFQNPGGFLGATSWNNVLTNSHKSILSVQGVVCQGILWSSPSAYLHKSFKIYSYIYTW